MSPPRPSPRMAPWTSLEKPPFDKGTMALVKAVAGSGAISVVGGGDSEKAIKAAGVAGEISHASTGGGASLEFLAGIQLPGVAALEAKEGGECHHQNRQTATPSMSGLTSSAPGGGGCGNPWGSEVARQTPSPVAVINQRFSRARIWTSTHQISKGERISHVGTICSIRLRAPECASPKPPDPVVGGRNKARDQQNDHSSRSAPPPSS